MEPNKEIANQRRRIGVLGEKITASYLSKNGFQIIAMNYLKKWGEIDIVAKKDNKVHFVEVKTVSYETKQDLNVAVAHGTWRPEENVHAFKFNKLSKVIESWLMENKWDGDWQIDVSAVRIVPRETYAKISYIDNVISD